MTPLAQGATGLAVALGFAVLGTRRTGGVAMLCAAQTVAVAIGALAQGEIGVVLLACVEAALLGWLGGIGQIGGFGWSGGISGFGAIGGSRRIGRLPLPLREAAGRRGRTAEIQHDTDPFPLPPPSRGGGADYSRLAAGALLAGLAATIPELGLGLAVVLLGLLVVAARRLPFHQTLGIAAAQNGLMLAALTAGLSGWRLIVVVLPWLPALAFGALWLGGDRARTATLRPPHWAGWIDAALCGVALLLACALPWELGAHGPFWRLAPLPVHVVVLLAALAAAASWPRRDAATVWGSRLAILAGTVLAVLAAAPLLSWLGMVLATVGASAAALPARAEAWRRLRLGCTGLGLALFGVIALHAGTPPVPTGAINLPTGAISLAAAALLPAIACVMLGYGTLAVLAPELAVAAVALILRVRGAQDGDLLLVLGLAALLVAVLGLVVASGTQRHVLRLVGLAQGGAAVFAFGLGTDTGNLAGLLQLSLLALTQCALRLTNEDGLDRLAAVAGLAGLPPFGLFPGLALILIATAQHLPWLLLPLGAGLAAVAWAILPHLPHERRLRSSPAWVPLALLLLAGFAMPDAMLDWFRLAAR